VAILFTFRGSTNPWLDAASRWTVYLTLADILCLLVLGWLTRREGMTLMDLVGVRGKAIIKRLAWAPLSSRDYTSGWTRQHCYTTVLWACHAALPRYCRCVSGPRPV
jgi:hypothetical protein